jgi:hypothetical protein
MTHQTVWVVVGPYGTPHSAWSSEQTARECAAELVDVNGGQECPVGECIVDAVCVTLAHRANPTRTWTFIPARRK